ncbi:hypothetical protein ACFO5T_00840 [Dokdonia genika]|uniref:DUF5658 domain-containing protein n=1 Tax=Dokdonia genika TaxID=308113 RepID=A0ABV9L5N4_9FLAO
MKIEKVKQLTYSIGFLIFGWLFYFLINYLNYSDFMEQFREYPGLSVCFPRRGKYDIIWFKLIAIGFGIISLYLNYKSKPLNRKKLRIFLSLLLLIMSIFAFPNLIWQYLI